MDMTKQQRIMEACIWAKSQGLQIQRGDWGVEFTFFNNWIASEGKCCPLGALLLKEQPDWSEYPDRAAAWLLGESVKWVQSFTAGIDGNGGGAYDIEVYEMAEAIMKELQ